MTERLDLDAIRHRWAPDLWDRNAAVAAAMQARQDVHALIAEVERLRAVLTELVAAHYVPPWGGDDPTYEKALAAGRRMDAAWDRAREALEGPAA